jgi:hypothetical protein
MNSQLQVSLNALGGVPSIGILLQGCHLLASSCKSGRLVVTRALFLRIVRENLRVLVGIIRSYHSNVETPQEGYANSGPRAYATVSR